MLRFVQVESEAQLDTLVNMAQQIWSEHFQSLFDASTLPRLIHSAQSLSAIQEQLQAGFQYYLILNDKQSAGYFAYRIDHDKGDLFLSKLYLHADQRRRGIGRKVLLHLEAIGRQSALQTLSLTVFHNNVTAIRAYERWGFRRLGLIKRRFADDLVFDDYAMVKSLLG